MAGRLARAGVVTRSDRLAANPGTLCPGVEISDALDFVANNGFQCVELTTLDMVARPVHEVGALVADRGLGIALMNALGTERHVGGWGLAGRADCRREFFRSMAKTLAACDVLMPTCVHLLGGIGCDWSIYERDVCSVASELADRNIRLTVEPINELDAPGYVVTRPAQVAQLAELSSNVFLQLDTFHAQRAGYSLVDVAANVGPLLAYVQVSCPPDRSPPKPGDSTCRSVVALVEHGYAAAIGLEHCSADGAATFAWLDDVEASLS
jgi:hydroxypyruvate isomerase